MVVLIVAQCCVCCNAYILAKW